MHVATLNANGLRAAARKGLLGWLAESRPDVLCLQETRVQADTLDPAISRPAGYHCFYHDAARRGYGGVAILARRAPDEVVAGLGWPEFDADGRYLEARFGALAVVSLYLPSGTSGPERQAYKFRFMDAFMGHLRRLRRSGREYIVCGDWNIAHRPIDLENWRANRNHSGFLPEERSWMDELFGRTGFVDAFRRVNPNPREYTWWSNRGRAWEKNVGWRLDYQVVTPGLAPAVRRASIYREQRFSDHAPLSIDYAWRLERRTAPPQALFARGVRLSAVRARR